MTFDTHVFISYAHSDNVEVTGAWVSNFHEMLGGYLESVLKRTKPVIWRDKRLSDNEDFDSSISENLARSAVMVAILSDNYVTSPWCQREAAEFCQQAESTIGLSPENQFRVFKVIKRPPETLDPLPKPFRNFTGTDFFVRMTRDRKISSDENDMVFELSPGLGEELAERLRFQVCLLAQDIAATLKAIEASKGAAATAADAAVAVAEAARGAEAGAAPAPPRAAAPSKATVYLAQCGEDRLDDHATLRSELLQRGYTVVPNGILPSLESECRAEIERLLATSDLSIHLLGTRSGALPGGEGADSIVAIQNALAVARGGGLRRVVSLPENTIENTPGERHRTFLEDIHRRGDLQGGVETQLITGDIQKVKTQMLAALAAIEAPPPPKLAAGPTASVYVIYDRSDLAASKPLRRALQEHATVLTPAFEGEPDLLREVNSRNLEKCDGVVVFCGQASDGWRGAVNSDLLRALAGRGDRPFRVQARWLDGELDALKEDMIGDPGVIDGRAGPTPELIAPIVAALKGAGDE